MIERNDNTAERQIEVMRYRALAEETTDPLASRLIRDIVDELEVELQLATDAHKMRL